MDKEKLGLAQYLKNHPVLSEDDAYKVKYLNVLEHFVRKFSGEDIFVKKILELYKVYFGVDEIYEYKEDKIPAFARSATVNPAGWPFVFFNTMNPNRTIYGCPGTIGATVHNLPLCLFVNKNVAR